MPTEPREFRILQHLQAALQAIAVDAGYFHNIAALAVKLDPNASVEELIGEDGRRPFVVLEVNPDTFAYEPAFRTAITMPVTLHAVGDSDPEDDASWLRTWSRLCADLEMAIAVDITRGQLAVVTRIVTREFQSFGGAQVWAMVKIEIKVRRTYGSPNE